MLAVLHCRSNEQLGQAQARVAELERLLAASNEAMTTLQVQPAPVDSAAGVVVVVGWDGSASSLSRLAGRLAVVYTS